MKHVEEVRFLRFSIQLSSDNISTKVYPSLFHIIIPTPFSEKAPQNAHLWRTVCESTTLCKQPRQTNNFRVLMVLDLKQIRKANPNLRVLSEQNPHSLLASRQLLSTHIIAIVSVQTPRTKGQQGLHTRTKLSTLCNASMMCTSLKYALSIVK